MGDILYLSFIHRFSNVYVKNVRRHVMSDVPQHFTQSHVCFTATYVVKNVYVYRRERMGTKKNVHAIITGIPEEANQNVHDNKQKSIRVNL